MEDRNGPGPSKPDPAPVPPEVPGPIPWISTESVSEVSGAAGHSTMRSLEMSGAYPLSDEAIDEAVTRTSPGNYALGYMDGDTFNVFYVGRSDSDVRQRLHEWVGKPSRYEKYASPAKASWGVHRRGKLPVDAPALDRVGNAESSYTRFAYSYAGSAEEAYAKEWRNYDTFGGSDGLDNETQPVSASGTGN